MCPPASISHRLDINVSSTDEEVLLFLGERKAGDPIPSNIITEVNPFSVRPWDSPEGKWYLYHFEDECSSNQRNTFQAIQIGYWRSMAYRTIYTDNVAAGRKTTWEFYIGQEPLGNRTGWLMYDYQRTHKECQGLNAAQDCSSMCRVFLQEDQRAIIGDQKPPDTEHCSPVSSDNADGVNAESMLLRFLEQEEINSPTNTANQSEVAAPEQRHDGSSPDLLTSDSAGDLNAYVEKGEYLELEDLYDLESTSSSSDDSSLISSNSDDRFDAEALLRDLENESCRNIKGSNTINNSHSEDDEPRLANSSPPPPHECSPKTSSPVYKSNPTTSVSVSCLRGHPKRTHSGSSQSSSSSNGSGSKSVRRISKLGKKYCCFGPF
uniref:NAC transcription factor 2 n=1 Tax=Dendrobium officinale TaxID=142615 RepID=A0A059PYG1_DENOF|nr:NAC transcription factor 2 [Dendrobium officinale]